MMVRCIVTAASDPTVTSRAGADRRLRTEPQVYLFLSRRFHITNNRMGDSMSRAPKRAPKWLRWILPDSTGFGRIPLDSLEKHEMFPLKAREIRAIPTLAYERCSEFSEQMRHPLLAARTFEWEK
jgi:hypothetical protein